MELSKVDKVASHNLLKTQTQLYIFVMLLAMLSVFSLATILLPFSLQPFCIFWRNSFPKLQPSSEYWDTEIPECNVSKNWVTSLFGDQVGFGLVQI